MGTNRLERLNRYNIWRLPAGEALLILGDFGVTGTGPGPPLPPVFYDVQPTAADRGDAYVLFGSRVRVTPGRGWADPKTKVWETHYNFADPVDVRTPFNPEPFTALRSRRHNFLVTHTGRAYAADPKAVWPDGYRLAWDGSACRFVSVIADAAAGRCLAVGVTVTPEKRTATVLDLDDPAKKAEFDLPEGQAADWTSPDLMRRVQAHLGHLIQAKLYAAPP
jgi:hypothetical protein